MSSLSSPASGQGAAFFDLDKTVLSTSASVALRHALVDSGLIGRRSAFRHLLGHVPYLLRGADEQRMQSMSTQLARVITGWNAQALEDTVRQALSRAIDPVVFGEALSLFASYREQGIPIVIASASLEQMVRPIGEHLGADFTIGSQCALNDDGTFTGELTSFNYLDQKAANCTALAEQHNWSMEDSFAYSDSVTDLPLLQAVGHPVAVNPDAALRRFATEYGWPIVSFRGVSRNQEERFISPLSVTLGGVAVATAGALAWHLARGRRAALAV